MCLCRQAGGGDGHVGYSPSCCWLSLELVDILAVAHRLNSHSPPGVIYGVDDAVIAITESVLIPAPT